jgi:hypothetical protein
MGGAWVPATIDRREEAEFAGKIWYLDWERPAHMPSPRGLSMRPGIFNRQWTIPVSPRSAPIARATGCESNRHVTRRIQIT